MKKHLVNDEIDVETVRLIGEDGVQMGIFSVSDAKKLGRDQGLDLLLLSKDARPPVCKIVNHGQFRYEQQKKEKLAKKNSRNHMMKELKFSPKISEHDYQVRLSRAVGFLKKGYKVKANLFFRGREAAHPGLGSHVINRFIGHISELGNADKMVKTQRNLTVIINPK